MLEDLQIQKSVHPYQALYLFQTRLTNKGTQEACPHGKLTVPSNDTHSQSTLVHMNCLMNWKQYTYPYIAVAGVTSSDA